MTDSSSESLNILIVEDERDLADLYTLWLADAHTVETAYTGNEALELLDSSFDIVLLDRRLPDISGDEVLEHITETAPDVQVAMISGIAPSFAILGYGIEHYLVKPITHDDIHDLITTMSNRRTYSEPRHELEQLRSRKAALEQIRSWETLQAHPEYQEVLAEIDRLEAELTAE